MFYNQTFNLIIPPKALTTIYNTIITAKNNRLVKQCTSASQTWLCPRVGVEGAGEETSPTQLMNPPILCWLNSDNNAIRISEHSFGCLAVRSERLQTQLKRVTNSLVLFSYRLYLLETEWNASPGWFRVINLKVSLLVTLSRYESLHIYCHGFKKGRRAKSSWVYYT